MPRVYPRVKGPDAVRVPIDSIEALTERIIQAKEDGLSRAEAAGICLAGSDATKLFNRQWKKVDRQVLAARAVNITEHITVTVYKAEIRSVAPLLDDTKWYNGMKAEKNVDTYNELVAKIEEDAELEE